MLAVVPLIPLAVIAVVALVVGVAASKSGIGTVPAVPKLGAVRATHPYLDVVVAKANAPGLQNTLANARTVYVKSEGRNNFYVGACYDTWLDDFQALCKAEGGGAGCLEKVDEWIVKIAKMVDVEAGLVVDWLMKHACLRMKASLRSYRIDGVGGRWWSVYQQREGDAEIVHWNGKKGDIVESIVDQLKELSPMRLKPRKGYKRAWVLEGWPTGTRNEHAMVLVWSVDEKAGHDIIQELVPEPELRRMALMISRTGAFTREDFDRVDSGRSHRWRPSIASQVSNEYPGLEP